MFNYESGKYESRESIFEMLLIIIGIFIYMELVLLSYYLYFQLGLENVENILIRAINNFAEY